MAVSRKGVTFVGVLILRALLFTGSVLGPLILGNSHKCLVPQLPPPSWTQLLASVPLGSPWPRQESEGPGFQASPGRVHTGALGHTIDYHNPHFLLVLPVKAYREVIRNLQK